MQPVRPWFSRRFVERPASPASGRAAALAALGLAVAASGCFVGDTALGPPLNQLYYPTGLVVSPGLGTLYVTNSDFDLQYNGGSVLAIDLKTMRHNVGLMLAEVTKIGDGTETIAKACQTAFDPQHIAMLPDACGVDVVADCEVNPTAILNPGPCAPIPLSRPDAGPPFATIGAFASGVVLSRLGSAGARLYVPVRGDPSITYFEIADDGVSPPIHPGMFDCGGIGDVKRCDKAHAIGTERFDNSRGVSLPVEPVGIAVSEDGTAIVTAHQTEKAVSLTVNVPDPSTNVPKPTLQFVLGNMPDGPTEVATVPIAAKINALIKSDKRFDYQPGFVVSYRASAEVDLFRFHADDSSTPRPFLTRAGATLITVNASGKDSRGIAVDPSARQACEAKCAGDDACLVGCLDTPLRVFIANRAPPSLLTGRIETKLTRTLVNGQVQLTGAYDQVFITDSIPLAFGASKITLGHVLGSDAAKTPSLRVFASAFDSRLVFSYDPEARRVDNVIKTGRGPHAIAVDTGIDEQGAPYSFLYIGHFTDSYLGVVDLDMGHPRTFGTMFASVGTPMPPRESK